MKSVRLLIMRKSTFIYLIVTCVVLFFSTSVFSAITDGLVAYYTFNGNANDTFGNNNGVEYGGVSYLGGVFGQSALFDGSNDYIRLPNQPLPGGETEYTISLWAKKNGISGGNGAWTSLIRTNTPGSKSGYTVYWDNYNTIKFLGAGSSNYSWNYYYNAEQNRWYHILVIYRTNGTSLYIDGNLVDSTTLNLGNATTPSWQFSIGGQGGGTDDNYYNGQIDDIRIYNRALSDTEIQELYYIQNGLVAEWLMEETPSTAKVIDSSGNNNQGTPTGTSVVNGKCGLARSFNGSGSDYITINDSALLSPTSSITVEAWVKPDFDDATGSGRAILTKGADTSIFPDYVLAVNSSKQIYFSLKDSSKDIVISPDTIQKGQWYHIVGTYDGYVLNLYVNGGGPITKLSSTKINDSNRPLYIGRWRDGAAYWQGIIDEVRIYNRALTPDEIAADMSECSDATYSIKSLSPDPNPEISKIMVGGTFYRYYQLVGKDNTPVSGAVVNLGCGFQNFSVNPSGANGILIVSLEADSLGPPDDESINCSITDVNNEPITPVEFDVKIMPRESISSFKFGRGVNFKAALNVGAKYGDKRGLVYTLHNAYPQFGDTIGIDNISETEAGVYVTTGVGGGVKGMVYAGASADAGISVLFSQEYNYLFSEPYTEDQKLARGRLILSSFFQAANVASPLVNKLIDYVNEKTLENYMVGDRFSGGIKVDAGANASAGIGIGTKKKVVTGIGVSAGISTDVQILAEIINSYEDANLPESGVGVSFSGSIDIGAGIQDIEAGKKLMYGINGALAGEYSLILYSDSMGQITRGEFMFGGTKDWGIGIEGDTSASGKIGSTKTVTFTVKREDLINLINQGKIPSLSCLYNESCIDNSNKLDMGPTRLLNEIKDLISGLGELKIKYTIEEEKGTLFSVSPEIDLSAALGVKPEVGVGIQIDIEKSVLQTKESGTIYGTSFPLATYYKENNYIPSPNDLNIQDVFNDAGNGIFKAAKDAGAVIITYAKKIGNFTIVVSKWLSTYIINLNKFQGVYNYQNTYLKTTNVLSEDQPAKFEIGGVFLFSPEDTTIAELSKEITSPTSIQSDNAEIVIQPGVLTAQITIAYSDSDIAGINENNLILFRWDTPNIRWIPADNSVVNTVNNKVTASIDRLGTFTLGIPLPQGNILLNVETKDVDINYLKNINVSSEPIKLSNGNVVPDETLVTVASLRRYTTEAEPFGIILAQDEDTLVDGLQIATNKGVITFEIAPPVEEGSGIVYASSVEGTATGKAYFNVVQNLDYDADNMPDYWENAYFGSTNEKPADDYDNDGMTNIDEYKKNSNPIKTDTDNDGMKDIWEVNNHLNPLLDDSKADPDNDSFTNLVEYNSGTDPNNLDSIPCIDIDNDGYGNPGSSLCSKGNITDCDDNNIYVNPSVTEGPLGNATCSDTKDNDCDGYTDGNDTNCKAPVSDLTVTSVSNPPMSKKCGSSFYIKDTVMNSGGLATGRFAMRYYLSLDTIKDDSDILLKGSRTLKKIKDGKSSNGKTKVIIKKSTLPGAYYLIVCADDTNKISESNETDNCTASNTTINVQ